MGPVALFDVDGTVISRDSFKLIVLAGIKESPWRIVLLTLFLPVFLTTACLNLEKQLAKSCTLWSLTVLRSKRDRIRFFKRVAKNALTDLWFVEMNAVLSELRERDVTVCYLSASGQLWLRALLNHCDPHPKHVIGSRMRFFAGGVILSGRNCYGTEKVHRLREFYQRVLPPLDSGFTDNPCDLPFLELCDKRFVINPKQRWIQIFDRALGENYTLCQWTSRRDPVAPQYSLTQR